MITLLDILDKVLIISASGAVFLGAVIFFIAGIYHIKDGYEAIVEKASGYYTTLTKGWYFKMPIVYQRVGLYCVRPQVRRYVTQVGNKLSVTYQIEDTQKFHYSGLKFETIMAVIEKENSEINLTVLQDNFAKYGLKFINIQKVND